MTNPPLKAEVSAADFVDHAEKYKLLWICGHLRELFPRLNVNCVWDVGANIGYYGFLLRSFVRYDGPLLSFEPVSGEYEKLVNRAANDDRWQTFKMALGSRDEERAIKVAENAVLSSFLEPSDYSRQTFGAMTNVVEEEVVPVRTVDSVAPEVMGAGPARIFLKLDTQGWDLEVIRGAEQLLPSVVGMQVELSLKNIYEGMPSYTETLAYVESKGLELSGVFPVMRDRQLRLVELDCVFVRPEEVSPQ